MIRLKSVDGRNVRTFTSADASGIVRTCAYLDGQIVYALDVEVARATRTMRELRNEGWRETYA